MFEVEFGRSTTSGLKDGISVVQKFTMYGWTSTSENSI